MTKSLFHNALSFFRIRRRFPMLLALGVIISTYGIVHAQQSDLGAAPAITEQPRMVEAFEKIEGNFGLQPDRFGTFAKPFASEMGLFLVIRIFRNVCVGLENGQTLEAVLPEGFKVHNWVRYTMGPDADERGTSFVLSTTGDLYDDEDGGHPAVTLQPDPAGMRCNVAWIIAQDLPMENQQRMAQLLEDWLPFELSLVPAQRPSLVFEPELSNATEWDRPCKGAWCPLTAGYTLNSGWIKLEATLNITDVEGARP